MIDQKTVELTHSFCLRQLAQHGYQRLYLIGSRARGTHRPTSDHDFVAVVNDDAPSHVLDGQNTKLQFEFCKFADESGIGKVDLLVSTKSRVAMLDPIPDDFVPYSCQQDGKVVWERN